MKITIKNYKNIINFNLEITDQKLNIIYGLSGTGKSSISEVLVEPLPINKSVIGNGEIFGEISPIKRNSPILSVFNEKSLDKYIFASDKEISAGIILIDNAMKIKSEKDKLMLFLQELKNDLDSCNDRYLAYNALQKKLAIKLTKDNTLTKTSALTKLRNTIKTKADTNIFKELTKIEAGYLDWLLKGTTWPQFEEDKCPFCEKKLNRKRKRKLINYNNYDKKLINSYKFTIDETSYLNTISKYNIKEIDKTEKEMLRIARANKGYETINEFLKTVSEDSLESLIKIEVPAETFDYYKELKGSVSKINRNIKSLSIKYKQALNSAKTTLSRKLVEVNELLERFGLQYEISAEYKNNSVVKYKIYHKHDIHKIERFEGLSYGEKRIFALIMFILESKKDNETDLFIFDDPVSSFDESRRYSFMNLIFESLKYKTILLLTHEQTIAKFGVINERDKESKFGKILYLENYDGNPKVSEIEKVHFANIESHILERLKSCSNYMQKIINLRLYYENNPKKDKKIFNYLTVILHGEYNKISKFQKIEKTILDSIETDTAVELEPFKQSNYIDIDLSEFCFFEKAFILREQIKRNKKYGLSKELSYYIHLNGRELITLDPYRFTCMTKYVYDNLSNMDQVVNIHQLNNIGQ